MHVLVIYMYYLRPGDPGIKRFNEFSRIWTEEHGLDVTVASAAVNHHRMEYYADMRGLRSKTEHDGAVKVIRAGHWPVYHKGFAGRALSQMSWARNLGSVLLEEGRRPDVLVCSSPPLFAAWPMLRLLRQWDIPAIFEVRDVWPESIVQAGLAGEGHPVVRYLAGLEKKACAAAGHIVTLVPNQVTNIVRRGLASEDSISCIPNGVVLADFENVAPDARQRIRGELGISDGGVLAMYIGQHGKLQNLGVLLDIARALQARPDIRLVTVGDGPEREPLMQQAQAAGLDNLLFFGRVSSDEIPAYLSAADIGLSFINTLPGTGWDKETRGVFRNCLFDIAGARLPIVFNMPGFTKQELEGRAQAGYYADTNAGPGGIAAHIVRLADDPELRNKLGENNYREIAVRYNRHKMAAEYVNIMSALTS